MDNESPRISDLKQRMYHLTMYNISEIQKGIQSYHAGIEYSLKFRETYEYKRWAWYDKVVIILNGGTSHNIINLTFEEPRGTMEDHVQALKDNNILHAVFNEYDLNNATSAIAFLCDEKVWDKETYPDPVVLADPAWDTLSSTDRKEKVRMNFEKQLKTLYGEKVAFLREWLKQFKLA
jgi:hypothetical protein